MQPLIKEQALAYPLVIFYLFSRLCRAFLLGKVETCAHAAHRLLVADTVQEHTDDQVSAEMFGCACFSCTPNRHCAALRLCNVPLLPGTIVPSLTVVAHAIECSCMDEAKFACSVA